MKKSRIIIPALAMIAFSVAASVTGAVAWFTASRSAQISAGSYSVVKTSADLKASIAPGVGTSVNTNTNTVSFNGLLTDGSFDHKDKFFTWPDSTGKKMGGTVDLTDTDLADKLERGTSSDSKTIYTAATFDVSFTIAFGATGEDVGLFLNNQAGKTSFTVNGGGTAVTATGFRMAFIPKVVPTDSLGRATVLADLQDDESCKYIGDKSAQELATTSYVATDYDLIDKDYVTAMPAEGALAKADALKRADYLGFFHFSSGQSITLTYTVCAWFEGTDPNIVNQPSNELYQTVVSQLFFEAINLAD